MYSNVKYEKVNGTITCITARCNGCTLAIPLDPANTDYQRIMQLVDSGQLVIDPAE